MNTEEKEFLKDIENNLWLSVSKLLPDLSSSESQHVILGLIFLKYVTDVFDNRVEELKNEFINPQADYYLGDDVDEEFILKELENRDYYTEKNIIWVPSSARWENIELNCRLTTGSLLPWGAEFKSVGKLLDDAMDTIEKENLKLKNILFKDFARQDIDDTKLAILIDLIAAIPFSHATLTSKDIVGHIYDCLLEKLASAKGKKGEEFFTPRSIVKLIVEILQPFNGRVYDPAMGSGGFLVQSKNFLEAHSERSGSLSIYGQESNKATWRLAAMNMAIRGIDFNFGNENAHTLLRDLHPDLRADYVMANPPFNQHDSWNGKLEKDKRWIYGEPSERNANFAWLQHMLYHLAPNGSLGLVLANGSMSSTINREGDIRQRLIEADLVECMIALPGQLFTNTQIPACIWFLTKNKKARNTPEGNFTDRRNQILFVDARNMGQMINRVQRVFSTQDIKTITQTVLDWKTGNNYKNIMGYSKSVSFDEIKTNEFILTPGRYVGIVNTEIDDEPFEEKMKRLNKTLLNQLIENAELEKEVRLQLRGIGYEI